MKHFTQTNELFSLACAYTGALRRLLGHRLVSVVLFGSVARRQARPDSDIDLILVVEGLPQGHRARQETLSPALQEVEPIRQELQERGICTDLAAIPLAPEEAAHLRYLYLDLTEEAVLLYDRDDFFAGVLARLRRRLRGMGACRVSTGNTWHWVLKPDFQPGEEISLDTSASLSAGTVEQESLSPAGNGGATTMMMGMTEVFSMAGPSNKEVARATFGTARTIAEEAQWLSSREQWHLVVRRCQEAVEMALKAALRWAGVEAPKEHDPGHILRRYRERFPPNFAAQIDRLALVSRHLRADRERSFYGDEEQGISPQELYSQVDAQQALEDMTFVLGQVEGLLSEGMISL